MFAHRGSEQNRLGAAGARGSMDRDAVTVDVGAADDLTSADVRHDLRPKLAAKRLQSFDLAPSSWARRCSDSTFRVMADSSSSSSKTRSTPARFMPSSAVIS